MRFNKILCIDDDTTIHFLNRIHIEDLDLSSNYIELLNGDEGIAYFEALTNKNDSEIEVPELLLLDINMPVMDGWEFLQKLNDNYAQLATKIKIYIITSSLKPSDKELAKVTKNVSGFFEKPLDEEQFKEIIKDFERDAK